MTAQITHFVRVSENQHGELQPIDYDACPLYRHHLLKTWCLNRNKMCQGIIEGNFIKHVDGKPYHVLQCSWCITCRDKMITK